MVVSDRIVRAFNRSGATRAVVLKACVRYFVNFYFSLNDSPLKTMKDVFCFI